LSLCGRLRPPVKTEKGKEKGKKERGEAPQYYRFSLSKLQQALDSFHWQEEEKEERRRVVRRNF